MADKGYVGMKMRHRWVTLVSTVIFWILSIIAAYWIILKLTGHSPTSDQIVLVMLGFVTTMTVKQSYGRGGINQKMVDFGRRLSGMARDMRKHTQDLGEMKIDIVGVKHEIGSLKQDVGVLKQDVGMLKQDMASVKHGLGSLDRRNSCWPN